MTESTFAPAVQQRIAYLVGQHGMFSPGLIRRAKHFWFLAIAFFMSSCVDSAPQQTRQNAEEIERVVALCAEAMVRSTCQVMNAPPDVRAANVVFVAGVGAVDATAYRQLRASGDAMCSVVRTACSQSWESAQCTTARGLWPASQ